jgi:hypothetical protein
VRDASCFGVYASHVLEHLPLNDFYIALENTKRILRPGGVFRLVVPDLESIAREYLHRLDGHEVTPNATFFEMSCLGQKVRKRGLAGIAYYYLNNSEHRWMWDAPSLFSALSEAGFTAIRRCAFGDSTDPMFSLVEDPGRFEGAIAMEACR